MRKEFSISGSNTFWVFISDSTESRHVYDVVHAVAVLHSKGVSDRDIRFFTDDHQAVKYTSPFSCPDPLPIDALSGELQSVSGYDNLFIVVGGHGGIHGVGHPTTKISPDYLTAVSRQTPGIGLVVIALAQCFAGVFNFADARLEPQIVMLGAANLGSSLSVPINFALTPKSGQVVTGWAANSFMFHLFRWLSAPKDIDGDSRVSLLDCYKSAGSSASIDIISAKPVTFRDSQKTAIDLQEVETKLQKEYEAAANELRTPIIDPIDWLSYQSLTTRLQEKVSLLHVSQEPWLLHADLARRVTVL